MVNVRTARSWSNCTGRRTTTTSFFVMQTAAFRDERRGANEDGDRAVHLEGRHAEGARGAAEDPRRPVQ